MKPDCEALGRRAVACAKWRWLPGMTVQGIHSGSKTLSWIRVEAFHNSMNCRAQAEQLENPYPNFNDAATTGCLLRLVREAWDDEWLACLGSYNREGARWTVHGGKPHGSRFLVRVAGEHYESEAEALIAALEAAP
jgi:hypothetical protein